MSFDGNNPAYPADTFNNPAYPGVAPPDTGAFYTGPGAAYPNGTFNNAAYPAGTFNYPAYGDSGTGAAAVANLTTEVAGIIITESGDRLKIEPEA